MRVVIPFTARHPETRAGAPEGAEWVRVSGNPNNYWALLRSVWADGEAFLIVEHDVVCRPDVVVAVRMCAEPWCAFPYDDMCCPGCMEKWRNMLGCTRFSSALIAAVPSAVEDVPPGMRHWRCLCNGLGARLREDGFTHHWHSPAVRHHHMRLAGLEA